MSPTPAPTGRGRPPALWILAWLALVVTALATRPLLRVDETSYLGVAWEMWTTGEYLVPHLNGEPYSHKPPLLFWLINLAWVAAHPGGKVIAYHDHGIRGGSPEFVQTYRNRQVAIWDAAQVLADPTLVER